MFKLKLLLSRIAEARPGIAPNRAPIAIYRTYVFLVTGVFIIAMTKPMAMSTIPIQVR